MPFRYSLQKVLNFRITKRDEQIEAVKKAQAEVDRIQAEIDAKYQEIYSVQANMKQADFRMYETYDNYIKHLYTIIAKLEEDKKIAEEKLREEQDKLVECEQNVKVLEKHKEHKKEEYLAEEKKAEMKQLDETGSIKHYRMKKEREEEEMLEELLNKDNYEY